MKIYAGIGSRKTPPEILKIMRLVGELMAENDWVLRSGAAKGADLAFEEGCDKVKGAKEIFLPWKGYNENKSPLFLDGSPCNKVKKDAFALAEKYRFQVLGIDLATPIQLIVCWTPYIWRPGVQISGGTSQTYIGEYRTIVVVRKILTFGFIGVLLNDNRRIAFNKMCFLWVQQ